jgi:hypothetical protein
LSNGSEEEGEKGCEESKGKEISSITRKNVFAKVEGRFGALHLFYVSRTVLRQINRLAGKGKGDGPGAAYPADSRRVICGRATA